MKKLQKWLILFVGILLITGCRDNASSNKKVNNGKSVNDVLEKQTKAEEQKEQTEEKDKKKESTDTSENTETEDVDYDLTEMNLSFLRDQRCAGVLRAGTGICPEK